jgi:hypothetical protein
LQKPSHNAKPDQRPQVLSEFLNTHPQQKKIPAHRAHFNSFTTLEAGFRKALPATFNQQNKPKVAALPSQSQ